MKPCRHVISILILFASLYSLQASAINYQDMWWNPSESGWGISIDQQADTIFAGFFIYDADGKPLWLTMAGTQAVLGAPPTAGGTIDIFGGSLYKTTGPAFSGPFDPALVTRTPVGSAMISFTDANNGSLVYTVNGLTVTKSITRFTFRPIFVSGTYFGSRVFSRFGCSNPANNGSFRHAATYVVTGYNGAINITSSLEPPANPVSCSYTGTYSQAGSLLQGSGSFNCNNGTAGTWSAERMSVTEFSLVTKFREQDTVGDTCTTVGEFGGIRSR